MRVDSRVNLLDSEMRKQSAGRAHRQEASPGWCSLLTWRGSQQGQMSILKSVSSVQGRNHVPQKCKDGKVCIVLGGGGLKGECNFVFKLLFINRRKRIMEEIQKQLGIENLVGVSIQDP